MNEIDILSGYIKETLGEDLALFTWEGALSLPLYLREIYEFKVSQIHGRDVLLMIVYVPNIPSPAVLAKHSGIIRERTRYESVIILSSLSAYNRKRLVERGVSFIVPGNQMYLAPLGIDFREHNRRSYSEVRLVQPATQYTIISILTRRIPDTEFTPSELSNRLGYSIMTLSRIFKELEAISFGKQYTSGRKRTLTISGLNRFELWNQALPHLMTPVNSSITASIPDNIRMYHPISGICALAKYSDLADPGKQIIALGNRQWRDLRMKEVITEVPSTEENATIIEIWKYPIQRNKETVDQLSLYLSLKDSPDERVQGALEQMLEDFQW